MTSLDAALREALHSAELNTWAESEGKGLGAVADGRVGELKSQGKGREGGRGRDVGAEVELGM
jgi:hypothetical protein